MGVPIYGIVSHVATATDKNGRSVPAPGKGLLVTARQQNALVASPILDVDYRRRHLEAELASIDQWYSAEREFLDAWMKEQAARGGLTDEQEKTMAAEQRESLELKHRHKRAMALAVWGNEFYRNDPYISPLTGGLAVWGLTIDDVEVASFHGTGTAANDINESQLLQKQLEHLGRTTGNCILSIFQKYLTGHPKGAAAAWMLNGLLQSMMTGIVPGNRNADNIDKELEACDHIVFLNRSLHTYGFKAGLLKSFGFGQVGGEILVIHPDYVLAQLAPDELDAYAQRRQKRYNLAYRHWHDSLTQRKSFVMVKDHAPYTYGEEQKVYLNPKVRPHSPTGLLTSAFKCFDGKLISIFLYFVGSSDVRWCVVVVPADRPPEAVRAEDHYHQRRAVVADQERPWRDAARRQRHQVVGADQPRGHAARDGRGPARAQRPRHRRRHAADLGDRGVDLHQHHLPQPQLHARGGQLLPVDRRPGSELRRPLGRQGGRRKGHLVVRRQRAVARAVGGRRRGAARHRDPARAVGRAQSGPARPRQHRGLRAGRQLDQGHHLALGRVRHRAGPRPVIDWLFQLY